LHIGLVEQDSFLDVQRLHFRPEGSNVLLNESHPLRVIRRGIRDQSHLEDWRLGRFRRMPM
jgi:hypothetical protein